MLTPFQKNLYGKNDLPDDRDTLDMFRSFRNNRDTHLNRVYTDKAEYNDCNDLKRPDNPRA